MPPVAVLWARQQLVVTRPETATRAEDHSDHRRRRVLRVLRSRRPREGPERRLSRRKRGPTCHHVSAQIMMERTGCDPTDCAMTQPWSGPLPVARAAAGVVGDSCTTCGLANAPGAAVCAMCTAPLQHQAVGPLVVCAVCGAARASPVDAFCRYAKTIVL
jgi:hypothetical protein